MGTILVVHPSERVRETISCCFSHVRVYSHGRFVQFDPSYALAFVDLREDVILDGGRCLTALLSPIHLIGLNLGCQDYDGIILDSYVHVLTTLDDFAVSYYKRLSGE